MQLNDKFNHNTKIIGVIGHPIKHSFSPLMHNLAFEFANLDYIYLPFDVPLSSLKDAIKGMTALGIKGFNVTLPLKEKITEYLSDISEEASVIGAVNTVVNENGLLHGYNTDVYGITASLNEYREEITDLDVIVIGAGGAARSVIYALIRYFKVNRINIVNRTVQKAESLKDYFTAKMLYEKIKIYELVPPDLVSLFNKSKLIINTSNIGMFPDIDDSATTIEKSFTDNQIVFDIVYNPVKTKFLRIAERQGAKTINGLKMFVEQGARSYELWTGEKMMVEKIYKTLESYLEDQ
ncbi:MAG: shikimate dehydrogenase [Melioribacteraceae bacterium]|nr:shikimate dehydrogenase [Melioribacteraceae bacterium]